MINSKQAQQLTKTIEAYQKIIIAKHIAPDWDAQGSALGLKEIILANFPKKEVYVVGKVFNSDKNFVDEEKLNPEIIAQALLITVDVANFERIDFTFKNDVKEVFKIDHHLEVDDFASHKLVDDKAIACTQVIVQWAQACNLQVNKDAATNLYFGLITDSGRFLYNKTNQETFNCASFLMDCGINLQEIYDKLYLKKLDVEKWLHHAFGMAVFDTAYPIAYIKITLADWKDHNITEEEVKRAVSVLSGIRDIEIWFIAYESLETEKIKVSLRSRHYEINRVAVKHNGGGHMLASGAKLNNFEEIENLMVDLRKLVDNKL
ncbi:DHH family protein [Spiroplasma clarkii]|uniref:Bifunctional oligoribonuclease and PAP phosphatase NrnA n=1 Tax=Spiroplasma clarkii TaxID=2139 RepID=A0A1Y0KZC2_9MOLU|nr:bifunctional oligoribonuclease/PAP phosphatase NrnA [Spiroplasma clarkii]ARU90855.1 DHH family protein [Spiroplasma clarkii]ATX71642.1 bifunctional oligoribonuclease and PAP phosphatase NrnA [Spiroplasma clarkii]